MDEEFYQDLRKLSFLEKKSMASIIREAIQDKMKHVRKLLTNIDIVIS
jgi:predicted DNA-binding protein